MKDKPKRKGYLIDKLRRGNGVSINIDDSPFLNVFNLAVISVRKRVQTTHQIFNEETPDTLYLPNFVAIYMRMYIMAEISASEMTLNIWPKETRDTR